MNLTTATPVEIDTELARLYGVHLAARQEATFAAEYVHHAANDKRVYRGRSRDWVMTTADAVEKAREIADTDTTYVGNQAARALARYDAAKAAVAAASDAMKPLNDEYRSRPWTRAFLVTDGHVHSSMDCSTCNNGEYNTQFSWLTEFSGGTEADVVAAAADRACTVCYPSAPVETAGPSALMTPDERTRAEKRDDAAKAREGRLAKKIAKGLTADGSEFVVTYVDHNAGGHERDPQTGQSTYVYKDRARTERFKTEQAATQWLVQYTIWDGPDGDKAPAFAAIVEAVAAKHGESVETVREEIAAKIAAKIKRDNR